MLPVSGWVDGLARRPEDVGEVSGERAAERRRIREGTDLADKDELGEGERV